MTLLIAVAVGCRPSPPLEPGVVALVEGEAIRAEDLSWRYWRSSSQERARARAPGGRHALLELVIGDMLLYQEARRRWSGPNFSSAEPFHRDLVERFLREVFDPTVRPEDISREAIEAEYRRTRESLGGPARRRVTEIDFPDRSAAEERLREIEAALDRRDEGAFDRLLEGDSDRGISTRSGVFDRMEAQTYLGEEIAAALFESDEAPRVIPPVRHIGSQWSVIVLVASYPPVPPPPLEEVEPAIRDNLFARHREERLNQWVRGFRDRHRVSVHPEVMALVPWTGSLGARAEEESAHPGG